MAYHDLDAHDLHLRRNFFPNHNFHGVFIDVGACQDKWLSMSRHFIESGWKVLSIEPNPEYASELRKHRSNVYEVAISDVENPSANFAIYRVSGIDMAGWSGLELENKRLHPWAPAYPDLIPERRVNVKVCRLDRILEEYNETNPDQKIQQIDIVSMDIEGNELNALRSLNFEKWQPRVLTIEECVPTGMDAPPMDIENFLNSKGYRFHSKNAHNKYYVHKDFKFD